MNSLTPFIDIIFYCLVEEEHQMSKLSFSPCNCKGSGGMAWRFGLCQTFLGSHLKFTGVNVKRPRQHACSHLSSDALIVSCFWCLVFLLYYTPLGLREATNIGRASSPSVSMVFMDSPKKCLSYRNFSTFSPIYFFSIGILGMPVQRFCGIRYAGCCTMLMQNAAPFYASKDKSLWR